MAAEDMTTRRTVSESTNRRPVYTECFRGSGVSPDARSQMAEAQKTFFGGMVGSMPGASRTPSHLRVSGLSPPGMEKIQWASRFPWEEIGYLYNEARGTGSKRRARKEERWGEGAQSPSTFRCLDLDPLDPL
ncbi:hypothetical protein D8B26_003913 [Coccidioides posadasii str. Silveira]|uniref:uncharacterized protein n=1 Tax=Coccidioides posadasii (strain RMSCC 757 / Silveira) TaxID=443226 RepID=UPI001BEEB55C|nr:hypothetical protein D8B26_003913 [Coccidioides posadasii str. Silveira]